MSDKTLFLNGLLYGFEDDVPDPFFARFMASLSQQSRYNVIKRYSRPLPLDSGDSVTVTPSGIALANWIILILKVVGTARLETTGKDTDGTTTINGYGDGYGTTLYPGYIILSTYNLSAITVSAQADDTVVELSMITSEDDS